LTHTVQKKLQTTKWSSLRKYITGQ